MAKRPQTGGSVPLARIAGVEIRMHWTFLALVALVVWVGMGAGIRTVGAELAWVVAIFASVLVHEYAHCIVARRRGAVVLGILLLPIGGLSQLEKVPKRPADELAIAIVGPLTSLGLAGLALIAGLGVGAHVWPPTLFAGPWLARVAWLNLLLGLFNLLPALPMDGGRVLRAALERHHDRVTATRLAVLTARALASAMMVVGIFYDFWLVLIGVFVLLGASAEEQAIHRPSRPGRPDALRSRAHMTTPPPAARTAPPSPPPQGAPSLHQPEVHRAPETGRKGRTLAR